MKESEKLINDLKVGMAKAIKQAIDDNGISVTALVAVIGGNHASYERLFAGDVDAVTLEDLFGLMTAVGLTVKVALSISNDGGRG
ncbi:XRE family transcriptional regulator [Vibrio harveyi]|uniref:XRE family transcriptional regulator n=1 Tax=Vibrio harveyi TaxID=669 RepID=UPI0018F13E3A|nr:XRE family transcriptional regulator [Vibrio harveyi]